MRIYTRKGDNGTTGLRDGKRVSKSSKEIEVLGSVDELVANLGLCKALCLEGSIDEARRDFLVKTIEDLQKLLMKVMAVVASSGRDTGVIKEEDLRHIEGVIDKVLEVLPPLNQFVVPGANQLEASMHVARTVCRRAERRAVSLKGVDPLVLALLNRTSDLLFVLARLAGCKRNEK
jgi:cob(I)alamin adenosyltransferase